jgi:hypothetical protein
MLEISEEDVKKAAKGLFAVNIDKLFCSHSFIAYVDKNLSIRDCYIADFQIDLPEALPDKKVETVPTEIEEFDTVLVKINLLPTLLVNTIRAIVTGKKIVILSSEPFINKHIENFLKYITADSFKNEITIISGDDYKKEKKKYEDHVVLQANQIIKDETNIINPKEMGIERAIVQNFLDKYNLKTSIYFLKHELINLHEYSRDLIDLLDKYKRPKKLGKKELIKQLNKRWNIKLTGKYLELLLVILTNYFDHDLSVISD